MYAAVGGGLGDVLVKHKSRLEKEKEAAAKIVAATHTVLPVAGFLQNADGKSIERSSEAGGQSPQQARIPCTLIPKRPVFRRDWTSDLKLKIC